MKQYDKDKIIQGFSRAADEYSGYASIQKVTAGRLARALEPWIYSLPEGPVLEVGAGTGFLTEQLIRLFPKRDKEITDASGAMLEVCRQGYEGSGHTRFYELDAETHNWPPEKYALIAGNFVAQWFKHPSITLASMANALKPGGFMLMSFPGSESYPNWRKYCLELGIPFTVNNLPDVEQVVINLSAGPVKVDFYEDQATEHYRDIFRFFRALKKSGNSTSFTGKKLTPKQLRLLNDYWLSQNNGRVTVHYHIAFIALKKDL
jgi:malonyl-CoA O-methyltransferase